jgi:hypothetical protein
MKPADLLVVAYKTMTSTASDDLRFRRQNHIWPASMSRGLEKMAV